MNDWYVGKHCESTALVNMLRNRGIIVSEPLVFGLGRGISFLYWHSKQMPAPFLGGRVKPDHLIRNAAAALGVELLENQTGSQTKAARELDAALDSGDVVGLKLDRFHLDYAHDSYHFAAHYVACVARTPEAYTLVETTGVGVQTTSRDSLAAARSAKGPMSSRNLSFRLGTSTFDQGRLAQACRDAIGATAHDFLHPPIRNMGHSGFKKASTEMRSWCTTLDDPRAALTFLSHSIEDGGTGGGFFRSLWADFLVEAADLTGESTFASVAETYRDISTQWTRIAHVLRDAEDPVAMSAASEEAADILQDLQPAERDAMARLAVVT